MDETSDRGEASSGELPDSGLGTPGLPATEEVAGSAPAPSDQVAPSVTRNVVGEHLLHNRFRDRHGRFRPKQPGESAPAKVKVSPRDRFLILDTWLRSGLPAKDFGPLVGVTKHTLYLWKKCYDQEGLAGLENHERSALGALAHDEVKRRAILRLKEDNPTWGVERIHAELMRTSALAAAASTVSRVLKDAGYEAITVPTHPHPPAVQSFERARPNQLWQTDLFTFVLKRQGRRVHMVVYLDDNSRFIVGFGLQVSATTAFVQEVLDAAIANYGAPEEVLTDNGTQFKAWRGKSRFAQRLEVLGIRHLVSRPRHPQTLGKTERFWGTLWREFVAATVFRDLEEARVRIGHFVDYYNFQRPHQGIGGLVPADRYFEAAPQVKAALLERVARNALEIAQHGTPRKTFYLTGRVGDESISLHAEGSRVVLTKDGTTREEVDLLAEGRRAPEGQPVEIPEPVTPSVAGGDVPPAELPAPGTSPLDEGLAQLSSQASGDELEDEDDGEVADLVGDDQGE